jgi:hypothetical protein
VAQLVYVRANIFGVLPTGSPLDHSKTGKLAQSRQGAIDIAPFSDSRGIAGFDSEVVVHNDAQLLFAAQVPLRRLSFAMGLPSESRLALPMIRMGTRAIKFQVNRIAFLSSSIRFPISKRNVIAIRRWVKAVIACALEHRRRIHLS